MNGISRLLKPRVMDFGLAKTAADELNRWGMNVVLTNGCFDILHKGHVDFLKRAADLGQFLMVGVNSDESVRALKGSGRPVNKVEDRMELVAALRFVDFVFPFEGDRFTEYIRGLRPGTYAKGGDYSEGSLDKEEVLALEEVAARIHILPLLRGYSTTSIINKYGTSKHPPLT